MTQDKVGHITAAGKSVLFELGLDEQEAATLYQQLQDEAAQTIRLKQQLMTELSDWISAEQLKQAEAAEILRVSRPRVSDVVNRKTAKFTLDALVQMLARTGKTVSLSVK